MSDKNLAVVNIITIDADGILIGNDAIIHNGREVLIGPYQGENYHFAVEEVFYKACRRIDDTLPEKPIEGNNELPDNYPDFDDGQFISNNSVVYWSEATT